MFSSIVIYMYILVDPEEGQAIPGIRISMQIYFHF